MEEQIRPPMRSRAWHRSILRHVEERKWSKGVSRRFKLVRPYRTLAYCSFLEVVYSYPPHLVPPEKRQLAKVR